MGDASLSSDGKLPAALPQLSFLVQGRFMHYLSGGLKIKERIRIKHKVETSDGYLLHLSDYFVSHVRVTLRKVRTSVNRDISLVGRADVQRSVGIEGVLVEGRLVVIGRFLLDSSDASSANRVGVRRSARVKGVLAEGRFVVVRRSLLDIGNASLAI